MKQILPRDECRQRPNSITIFTTIYFGWRQTILSGNGIRSFATFARVQEGTDELFPPETSRKREVVRLSIAYFIGIVSQQWSEIPPLCNVLRCIHFDENNTIVLGLIRPLDGWKLLEVIGNKKMSPSMLMLLIILLIYPRGV
jgi:hypothetical protein